MKGGAKPLRFSVLVRSADGTAEALRFSTAAIERGWTLLRVFFLAEGTLLATSDADLAPWYELQRQARSGDLWVCASSLARRGGGAPAAGVKAGGLRQLASLIAGRGSGSRRCCFLIGVAPGGADPARTLQESLERALSFALLNQPLDLILTGAAAALPQADTASRKLGGMTPEIIELWEFLRDSAAVSVHVHEAPRSLQAPHPQLDDRDVARLLARGGPTFCL